MKGRFSIILPAVLIFFYLIIFPGESFPVQDAKDIVENGIVEDGVSDIDNKADKGRPLKKANVDMLVLYGIYNNYVESNANISYNEKHFVSLLKSDLNRSNDFSYGDVPFKDDTVYSNSSFYENKLGFTINFNYYEPVKWIIDIEANNDSRGMFNNDIYEKQGKVQIYSREEKDTVKGSLKTVTRAFSKSSEVYLSLGGAQYAHRLIKVASEDPLKSKVNQINYEFGGEYIWSASNRVKYLVNQLYYNYAKRTVENDNHFKGEVIYSSKLPLDFVMSFGLNFNWNKDIDKSPYIEDVNDLDSYRDLKKLFIVGLTFKGFEDTSAEFLYRFDIIPFQPEVFYLEQKYIRPTFDLPPSEVFHSDLKIDYKANSMFKLKLCFVYEEKDNSYNYYTVEGNVLSADIIDVRIFNSGLDATLKLYEKLLELTLGYMYSYYKADINFTYHPDHKLSSLLKLETNIIGIEWGNKLVGNFYIDPIQDDRIPGVVIGHLGVQFKKFDGFYPNLKIDNLYNNRYNLREGYPEPGISILMGLRILI